MSKEAITIAFLGMFAIAYCSMPLIIAGLADKRARKEKALRKARKKEKKRLKALAAG